MVESDEAGRPACRREAGEYVVQVRLQSTDIRHVPDKVYQPGHKEHKDNYLISRNGSQSEYVSKRELMRSCSVFQGTPRDRKR
jgi:hypothetical protein